MKRFGLAVSAVLFLAMLGMVWGCKQQEQAAAPAERAAAEPQTAPVAAPVPKPIEGVMVSITIGDLNGLIDRIGSLASQISPTTTAQSLKAMAGGRYNDPELNGFPAGSGFVILMPEFTKPIVLAEVDPSMIDTYQNALKDRGLPSRLVDGVLVSAADDSQVEVGLGLLAAGAKDQLAAPPKPTIDITVNLPYVMERHGIQVDGFVNMMLDSMRAAQGMAMQDGMTTEMLAMQTLIVEGEVREFLALARQLRQVDLTIDFQPNAVRIDKTIVALPDTNLAALLKAPHAAAPDALVKLTAGTGTIRGAYSINYDAMDTFMRAEADAIVAKLGRGKEAIDSYLDMCKAWFDVGGESCAFDMLPENAESLLQGCFVASVEDPDEMLNALRKFAEDLNSSTVSDFYAKMGMPMTTTFTENTRTYEGVRIHRLAMELNLDAVPPEMKALYGKILSNLTFDYALEKRHLISAMGGASIDPIIDAVKKGQHPTAKPLASQKTFEPGACAYVDLGLAQYLKIIMAAVPQDGTAMFAPVMEAMAKTPPILLAAWARPDSARFSASIPNDLILAIGKMAVGGVPTPAPETQ